jgi:hypothetical protein
MPLLGGEPFPTGRAWRLAELEAVPRASPASILGEALILSYQGRAVYLMLTSRIGSRQHFERAFGTGHAFPGKEPLQPAQPPGEGATENRRFLSGPNPLAGKKFSLVIGQFA